MSNDTHHLRTARRAIRLLDHDQANLPCLSQGRESEVLFRALMAVQPERGVEFLEASAKWGVIHGGLSGCAGVDEVYDHPAVLARLLSLAEERGEDSREITRVALCKLGGMSLELDHFDECLDVLADPKRFAAIRYGLSIVVDHMDDAYTTVGMTGRGDTARLVRMKAAYARMVGRLLERGVSMAGEGMVAPDALIRACIHAEQIDSDQPRLDYWPIAVVIEAGADWQRALTDPRVGPYSRQIIEDHPLVRRARLEAVADSAPMDQSPTRRHKL